MSKQTPPCVLIVEDDALLRTCTILHLKGDGLDVLEAEDAEQALERLRDHPEVTTVFSDINMPGRFDGLALVTKIAKLRPSVRLILTSGRAKPAGMPEGVRFLAKPYRSDFLTDLIRAA